MIAMSKTKTYNVEFSFENAGLTHVWIKSMYSNDIEKSIENYLDSKTLPFEATKENVKHKVLKYGK